jgi:hypothetical protein
MALPIGSHLEAPAITPNSAEPPNVLGMALQARGRLQAAAAHCECTSTFSNRCAKCLGAGERRDPSAWIWLVSPTPPPRPHARPLKQTSARDRITILRSPCVL